MGLWRGKKGSSVFYYLRNSNNREKQGIREYQPVVANPQTAAQISQRVYMRPAQNIYRELADIIRRSWQGLEYGGKGTQEFFKGALRHGSTLPVGIPWLNKGDQRTVPGAYKISNGSIPEITATIEEGDIASTSLYVGSLPGDPTWGEVSERLIANNNIKEGDQLTFIAAYSSENEANLIPNAVFAWQVDSIYVDTSNTTPLTEILPLPSILTSVQGQLALQLETTAVQRALAAVGVIASRLSNSGNYLRSPATIAVNTELLAYWYTPTRYLEARNSYRIWGSTRSGNWVVDENAGDAPASRETVDGTYTLNGLTGDKASANGIVVRVQRYADDNSLAAVYVISVEDSGTTIYPLINNASGAAVQYTGTGGAFGYVLPADQPELANLQKIIQG